MAVKKPSRPQRWADAAGRAVQALQELQEVQEEYREWLGNLHENLQTSATGEKLQEIDSLDIEDALSTAQEAEAVDLPRGFGRD